MAQVLGNLTGRLGRLGRSAGPIFTKEFRTAGRRKRTYLLRVGYVVVLAGYVTLVWTGAVDIANSGTFAASRMADAGRAIIAQVMQFQFWMIQLVTVALLAGAVNGEAQRGTLETLLATPLTARQILLGKLLGGLLEVLMLVGISLPVLAIVRVFGGVPWAAVVAGLLTTLTAAFVTGLVAMTRSARHASAPRAVLAALPMALMLAGLFSVLLHSTTYAPAYFWHVLIALPVLGAVCLWHTWRTCRTAFGELVSSQRMQEARRPAGQSSYVYLPPPWAPAGAEPPPGAPNVAAHTAATPPGPAESPILWRALRRRWLKSPADRRIAAEVAVILLGYFYLLMWSVEGVFHPALHILLLGAALAIGATLIGIFGSGAIAGDRQARIWPLLLTTPLTDRRILWDKARGVLWRALPLGLFVAAHVALFTLVGVLHPLAAFHVPLLAAGLTIFLTGEALFFSAVCRRPGRAMLLAFGLPVALWLVLPPFLDLAGSATRGQLTDVAHFVSDLSPFRQLAVIVEGGMPPPPPSLRPRADDPPPPPDPYVGKPYHWSSGRSSPADTTLMLFLSATAYAGIGIALAWLAQRNFRRHVFD